MNDPYFPALDSLENRLGDALGLAIGLIRHPEKLDNRTMATIEGAFAQWCDKQIDDIANETDSF
ncbi:MAG: hypothetical protein ACO38U_09270 [Burkholderiaceae bacterium]